MKPMAQTGNTAGFSLVEVMVVVLLVAALGAGIYVGVRTSLAHSRSNRHRSTAVNLAQAKLEQLRNTDFFRVQSVPGSGLAFINTFVIGTNDSYLADQDLLQQEPVRLDTPAPGSTQPPVPGTLRVFADDVDDTWDGTGASNVDGMIIDYKRLRAQVTWRERDRTLTEQLVTLISGETGFDVAAPPSETGEAGQLADVQKPTKGSAPKAKSKPGAAKKAHVPDASGD